jgi:hypothetical protein
VESYALGEWAHYTSVLKEGKFYVYINGKLASPSSGQENPSSINSSSILTAAHSKDIYIGSQSTNHLPPIDGALDDFRIYNRALTESEIAELAGGAGTACTSGGTVSQNLDIYIPSLQYNTPLGSQNIWVKLGFHGQGPNGELLWKLNNFGQTGVVPTARQTAVNSEETSK